MAAPQTPFASGEFTVIDFGEVLPTKAGWHDADFVYPRGYHCTRKHLSLINPAAKCVYHSEVIEGSDQKPIFRVTCEDDETNPIEDTTPTAVWGIIFERIAALTRRSSRAAAGPTMEATKGQELYGFINDRIKRAIMELPNVDQCKLYKAIKIREERKEKEAKKEEKENDAEAQERVKKLLAKMRSGKKGTPYVQPEQLMSLELGEFRCMEESIEVVPTGTDAAVALEGNESVQYPEDFDKERQALNRIWEFAAAVHFIRTFRVPLGLSSVTTEDVQLSLLECNTAFKIMMLRLLLPANERKKANEMGDGDEWLHLLRNKLRDQRDMWDEESGNYEKSEPLWKQALTEDPMPEGIDQYYDLSLRNKVLILWLLCEDILNRDEDGRLTAFPNLDWDDADKFRAGPSAFDSKENALYYFDGTDGIVYREGPPVAGRKRTAPRFEAICVNHEQMSELGKSFMNEGKKKKNQDLQEFGKFLHEEEAPKIASKAQSKERAKSRQAMYELMPRKRSSRVVEKEEQKAREEEERKIREEEERKRRVEMAAEAERRKKEKEREARVRQRQADELAAQQAAEKEKQDREEMREKRLRKRRKLIQKLMGADAPRPGSAEPTRQSTRLGGEVEWWEQGQQVEIFTEDDWWQATVLKTRQGLAADDLEIYVAYVGGTEEDNEWIPIKGGRARAPTESWDDEYDAMSTDEEESEENSLEIAKQQPSTNGPAASRTANQPHGGEFRLSTVMTQSMPSSTHAYQTTAANNGARSVMQEAAPSFMDIDGSAHLYKGVNGAMQHNQTGRPAVPSETFASGNSALSPGFNSSHQGSKTIQAMQSQVHQSLQQQNFAQNSSPKQALAGGISQKSLSAATTAASFFPPNESLSSQPSNGKRKIAASQATDILGGAKQIIKQHTSVQMGKTQATTMSQQQHQQQQQPQQQHQQQQQQQQHGSHMAKSPGNNTFPNQGHTTMAKPHGSSAYQGQTGIIMSNELDRRNILTANGYTVQAIPSQHTNSNAWKGQTGVQQQQQAVQQQQSAQQGWSGAMWTGHSMQSPSQDTQMRQVYLSSAHIMPSQSGSNPYDNSANAQYLRQGMQGHSAVSVQQYQIQPISMTGVSNGQMIQNAGALIQQAQRFQQQQVHQQQVQEQQMQQGNLQAMQQLMRR